MSTYRRNRVRILGESSQRKGAKYDDEHQQIGTCQENTHQFLQTTAIHGMRYMGDSKLTIFERVIFTGACVLMFGLAIFYIWSAYNKWTNSPIITTLNAFSTPINQIPFPAVTICNMNQVRKSAVQNIPKGSMEYQMLRSLCRTNIEKDSSSSNNTDWLVFRNLLEKVAHPCKDILITCRFAQKYENCLRIFQTFMTDEGLCCTFNRIDKRYMLKNYMDFDEYQNEIPKYKAIEWTPEKGFPLGNNRTNSYPRTGFGSGTHMGLTVLINVQSDEYYCSSTDSKGFKVLLHPPTETPKIANYGFSISPGRESRVVITPSISDASNQIRKIPRHQRQCVFDNEGNLTYFKVYSQKNCEMECESRILLKLCGCIMFYMPRIGPRICNRDDYECYSDVLVHIEIVLNETFRCDCLPGCFDISYSAAVSSSELTREMIIQEDKPFDASTDYIKANLAVMHVFYANKFFRSHSKEELIGFADFLSNIGGLLGLFMGFSVFSLIEIVYFLTIRPYCAVKKNRMKKDRLPSINQLLSDDDKGNLWNIDINTTKRISVISTDNYPTKDQKHYNVPGSLEEKDEKDVYLH